MVETITAEEAGRQFLRLLAEVEAGAEYVIARDGRPIARIVPERADDRHGAWTPEQHAAWADLMEIFKAAQPSEDDTPFDRDSLYDRGT